MRSILYLAWRYVLHNRLKTSILVVCLASTAFLPLAVQMLVRAFDRQLMARARATPLVLGSRGNRYDLVLQTLYFRAGKLDEVPASLLGEIDESGHGRAIPIHARFTARGAPIVGTSLDYFEFRGLRCAAGRLPALLGEAVVGSEAAGALRVGPDDALISDQQNIYDLSRTVPVRLRVVGVLEPNGTPDDHAVFVDVKTAWVIEGLGHGHADLAVKESAGFVLERREGHVTANAALETLVEITPETIGDFHFHGDPGRFPLSSVIVVPADVRGETILATRYNARGEYRMLSPEDVVLELMGVVFRVKVFFDANFVMVALSTALFLALVVLLSLRIRRRERATLHRMGGSRSVVFWLQFAELGIVGAVSVAVATALALALLWLGLDLFVLL